MNFTLLFLLSLIFLLIIPLSSNVDAFSPKPYKASWKKDSGEDNIQMKIKIDSNFEDDPKLCITSKPGFGPTELAQMAAAEWFSGIDPETDDYPAAGEKGNPKNTGSKEGDVMDKDIEPGEVSRSYTPQEKDALKNRYSSQGGMWLTILGENDEDSPDILIKVGTFKEMKSKNKSGFALGRASHSYSDDKTTKESSTISIHPISTPSSGRTVIWFCTWDENGDGRIDNNDPKPPADQFDLYSVLKHELGHALSLHHSIPGISKETKYETTSDIVNENELGLINSGNDEFSSSTSKCCDNEGNKIYFSSDRPGGIGGLDIWYSVYDGQTYQTPINAGPMINTEFDEKDPSIIESELVYSSNRFSETQEFDLYLSNLDIEGEFSPSIALEEINTGHNEISPALSIDGFQLFFTSDRPNGMGGEDIWVAEWSTELKTWINPKNLNSINSESNESYPDISNDVLFFSSNRDGGFGGLDIWKSVKIDNSFTNVENLGKQLNSNLDEFAPNVNSNLDTLYFSKSVNGQFNLMMAQNIIPQMEIYEVVSPIKSNEDLQLEIIISNEAEFKDLIDVKLTIETDPNLEIISIEPESLTENELMFESISYETPMRVLVNFSNEKLENGGTVTNKFILEHSDLDEPIILEKTTTILGPIKVVENTDFSVLYDISGGELESIVADVEAKSLILTVNAQTDGILSIVLPNELIQSELDEVRKDFSILVDGIPANHTESMYSQDRKISIAFLNDTHEIIIIGTHVVPEFGMFILLIFAIPILLIITLSNSRFSLLQKF